MVKIIKVINAQFNWVPPLNIRRPKNELFTLGNYYTCTYGLITTRSLSSDSRKKQYQPSKDRKVRNLKGRPTPKGRVPSAGFIGKTRFDLIYQLFKDKLPKEWNLKDLVDKTVQAHDEIILHHGVVGGTSKWKAIVQYSIGLLEGRDPENPGWVATGRTNKWPKKIRHLLPVYIFIKDNIHNKEYENQIAEAYRFCLTLFKLNRVCTANTELLPLLENIGKRHRIPPALVSDFEKYVRNRVQEERERITLSDLDIKLFLSPSNGPNRLPKLETALEEAAVLERDKKLLQAFKRICTITNSDHFFLFFSQCAKKYQNLPSKLSNIKLRKLTAIPDKGNKARVIAICDIWTQSVLASLESSVIAISAKLFPNNLAYFSHSKGWDVVKSLPPEVLERCVSLDASSWTDNFPASLQFIVVKALYGESFALCWKALAVDCPWYVPNMPRPIFFGKGQGMGTKGSFAIAQLTDLLFVEFILQKEYSGNRFFIKVGDDLVVEDPDLKLKSAYETIGVPINLAKSKFKTSFGTFQEFVSRNLWNNYDYSIFSPSLVAKFLRDDHYSLTLYYHVAERTGTVPKLTDLLRMKRDIVSTKANFDLEKWQERHKQLIKVINLLILGFDLDPEILGPEERITFEGQEALLIAQRLIQLTIGLVTHYTVLLDNDPKLTPNTNLTKELVGEFREFRKANPLFKFLFKSENLFKYITQESITFKEAVILQRSSIFLTKSHQLLVKGSNSLESEPRYEAVLKDSVTGALSLNPDFVKFNLQIWGTLLESVTNHSVVGTNPFADRNPGRNDLELFKLGKVIVQNDHVILDFTNGTFKVPGSKGKYCELPLDLVKGYTELFRFDRLLSLDNRGEDQGDLT